MRHVGVREFRDKATAWLKGSQPLAVERLLSTPKL